MIATIIHSDCRAAMAEMEAESIDAIVTDPPYGLGFMGKGWDHAVPGVEFWEAALRVAKPGAHLVAFGGTRLYHRLACAIEDAGWEIRDGLMWLYGSGFPKSLDVSKAIDKEHGAEREIVGRYSGATNIGKIADGKMGYGHDGSTTGGVDRTVLITAPATDDAKRWAGWGTALKPAWEPIILARKPLAGTVARTVLAHGTGALNIDGCRIPIADGDGWDVPQPTAKQNRCRSGAANGTPTAGRDPNGVRSTPADAGRWPANLVLDADAAAVLDEFGDRPSRFFYSGKATKKDRTNNGTIENKHPTVKPTGLMAWLCRLVCPPGGTILDPFCGSGSTGKAAVTEGFDFIGIDNDHESCAIARERCGMSREEAC